MSSETFVLLSGALSFGAPLFLAIKELRDLRRPNKGSGWSGPSTDPAPRPHTPKPLPDCLIPKPRVRTRELEDA